MTELKIEAANDNPREEIGLVFRLFCDAVRTHHKYRQIKARIDNMLPSHEPSASCDFSDLMWAFEDRSGVLRRSLSEQQQHVAGLLLGQRLRLEVVTETSAPHGIIHDNWPANGGRPLAEDFVEGIVNHYCMHHGGLLLTTSAGETRHVQVADDNGSLLVRATPLEWR
jgi:hypothetical protein